MQPFFNLRDIATIGGFEFESPCRYFSSYAYLEQHTALCKVLTRFKMYVDTRDRGIVPHLIMDGFWETWLSQYLAKIVNPGDVCLDIGANLGYFSILMSALAGDKGKTIAFEPNPRVAELLRGTGGINSPGFSVAELALADKPGKMTFHIPEANYGDASLLERSDRKQIKKTDIEVEVITLDQFLQNQNIDKVDVIKMDVEGAEPLVFKGMSQTIAKNKNLQIIIEYSPYLYDNPREFTEYLFSEFTVKRIKDVEQIEELDKSAIDTLLKLTDHTDIYLCKKGATVAASTEPVIEPLLNTAE